MDSNLRTLDTTKTTLQRHSIKKILGKNLSRLQLQIRWNIRWTAPGSLNIETTMIENISNFRRPKSCWKLTSFLKWLNVIKETLNSHCFEKKILWKRSFNQFTTKEGTIRANAAGYQKCDHNIKQIEECKAI